MNGRPELGAGCHGKKELKRDGGTRGCQTEAAKGGWRQIDPRHQVRAHPGQDHSPSRPDCLWSRGDAKWRTSPMNFDDLELANQRVCPPHRHGKQLEMTPFSHHILCLSFSSQQKETLRSRACLWTLGGSHSTRKEPTKKDLGYGSNPRNLLAKGNHLLLIWSLDLLELSAFWKAVSLATVTSVLPLCELLTVSECEPGSALHVSWLCSGPLPARTDLYSLHVYFFGM